MDVSTQSPALLQPRGSPSASDLIKLELGNSALLPFVNRWDYVLYVPREVIVVILWLENVVLRAIDCERPFGMIAWSMSVEIRNLVGTRDVAREIVRAAQAEIRKAVAQQTSSEARSTRFARWVDWLNSLQRSFGACDWLACRV